MNVVYGKTIGGSPAMVNRNTGTIVVNKAIMSKLTEPEQRFIIEHESGHYYKNTSNEFIADAFASAEMLGTQKGSLKGSLHALEHLDLAHNKEHLKRYLVQLQRVAQFDLKKNNNENALKITDMLQNEVAHFTEDEVLEDLLKDSEIPDEEFNSFFGSAWRARKQAREELKDRLRKKHGSKWWMPHNYLKYRHDYKLEKNKVVNEAAKEYKLEKWRLKEEHKDIKAEGEINRPKEDAPIYAQQPLGNAKIQANGPEPKADNNKMLLYGGIGLVGVLIISFIAYKFL